MREAQVYAMQAANTKRNALLFGQFEFLDTRLQAIEIAIKKSRLKDRIKWSIWPQKFLSQVDDIHFLMIKEREKKRDELAKKPKLTKVS